MRFAIVDELAKIVYHNYLFPNDAYTLVDIAAHNDNGYDKFYLILEQPFVTPLTDAHDNIVIPTDAEIAADLANTSESIYFWEVLCSFRQMEFRMIPAHPK